MSGFVASEFVEPLDYDFTAIDGPKGTTPEPSRDQVRQFFRALAMLEAENYDNNQAEAKAAAEPQDGAEPLTAAQLAVRILDSSDQLSERELDIIAEFCSGSPSREEIAALPARHQRAWMGWLVGRFRDPQLPTVAMRPSLAVVPSA